MSNNTVRIKQGATFRLQCQWLNADGTGADITNDTLRATMKNRDHQHIFTINVEYEASGEFEVYAAKAATAGWPIGSYQMDIVRTTAADEDFPTETFFVEVEPKVS